MPFRRGETVLVRMEFHQTDGAKVRPAVVLLDTGDEDLVAAPVTSRARTSDFDFAIQDWRAAGLNVPSWVRVHKLTVLPRDAVLRQLGMLTPLDRETLGAALRRAFPV